jgi:serine/threonine protein kinase
MFNPGQLLADRYTIQKQLSKKAGRRTFLTYDTQTQEPAVVKLLLFGHDFEWDDLKLFEREAKTLTNLDHPSIPRYLDLFEVSFPDCRGFALVQTYIEAKSLKEHLEVGRTFSEDEVKDLAIALLDILMCLHERQPPIIHRDIKPSNILLSDRSGNNLGDIYLVDFGSVQTLAAKEGGTITVVGTYGYMPPEQFGDRAVPASDLYALGATLIHLVTGIPPVELLQDDMKIHFEDRVSCNTHFSEWLAALVEPTLDRRISSARQSLDALKQDTLFFLAQPFKESSQQDILKVKRISASLKITTKSFQKLEISNQIIQSQNHFRNFLRNILILVVLFIFLFVACLIHPIAAGFLCLWLILSAPAREIASLSRQNSRETRPCVQYIRFDTKTNQFILKNDDSAPFTYGSIASIRNLSVHEVNKNYLFSASTEYAIHIHTKRKHGLDWDLTKLDWNLTEEECVWIVHEIQNWLHAVSSVRSS